MVIGLHLTQLYFGFMPMLGVLSLAGIIINNAIVLIDRINSEATENGGDLASAIIMSAQHRLRPILLTTITTIGGLIPLYTGFSVVTYSVDELNWVPVEAAAGLKFTADQKKRLIDALNSYFAVATFKPNKPKRPTPKDIDRRLDARLYFQDAIRMKPSTRARIEQLSARPGRVPCATPPS